MYPEPISPRFLRISSCLFGPRDWELWTFYRTEQKPRKRNDYEERYGIPLRTAGLFYYLFPIGKIGGLW